MRWGYKTVFFGLKKDGLLGSAFLDDAEIELALNEYGRAGWELVSIFETRDGVLAVFKQPLGMIPADEPEAPVRRLTPAGRTAAAAVEPLARQRPSEPSGELSRVPENQPAASRDDEGDRLSAAVAKPAAAPFSADADDEPALYPVDDGEAEDEDDDIGGIRIE